jgi:hypothetical protein
MTRPAPVNMTRRLRTGPSDNVSPQGTPIPWPQCHTAMISQRDGGPARTRTWDQWIMSNTVTLRPWKKAEDV